MMYLLKDNLRANKYIKTCKFRASLGMLYISHSISSDNVVVRSPVVLVALLGFALLKVKQWCTLSTFSQIKSWELTMSTKENKERHVVQLRLDKDLSERLAIAMKEDGDDNKSGWIKRLLRRELDKRGIESKN
ncbi:hypothetical protein [Photorhabdus australis]